VLRDLGSSNGTFLNGKRILEPSTLEDGGRGGDRHLEDGVPDHQGPPRPKNAEIVHTGTTGELEGVVARTSAKANFVPVEQIQDVKPAQARLRAPPGGPRVLHYVRLERDLTSCSHILCDEPEAAPKGSAISTTTRQVQGAANRPCSLV